jgi:isopentenyl diphosphate isomerase/L-lactate dehydrogenase-like FMN-dependent dehydrogenase
MQRSSRRRFLQFLAASPLWGAEEYVIADAKEAINLLDFEAAARKALPPAHFGYLATGVEDDATLRANRAGFSRIQLRQRRLIDITRVDTGIELFGARHDLPVLLAPIGNQKAFHPEGEVPVARAARAKRFMQILSTATNTGVEQIASELGQPPWYQLYTTQRWPATERIVRRVEAAGCPVLAVTVDTQAGRITETFQRSKRLDSRPCAACHDTKPGAFYLRKPMYEGIDPVGLSTVDPAMTWEHARRLKAMTRMKLLIKGIETREDAQLCVEHGIDGIIVSNHGGRAGETGRGTIECLPEVLDGVSGRIPVLIDGGFRRGSDVFKALALGAKAVCIGRPYVWASSAFGQPGVERVLDLIRAELQLTMKQCGARSIAEITRAHVIVNKS